MTSNSSIREETYPYFLQEVPELLQVLEQGLLRLRDASTLDQVNTLMRATHTLKGAAASVGLETIALLAHSLEDIFKALCRPDVSIDPDVEALLFEGFECLRLPLIAELTGNAINHTEVLDRAAAVFAQLQEKLGDCFGQEAYIPTSLELGFDVTQSLFEIGVTQRLEQVATAIATAPPEEIGTAVKTQLEVFLGLAESLNLPGFGAIAQAALTALHHHPGQAMTIAQVALADLQDGQTAVLAGDRLQGGQPSAALQQLADLPPSIPVVPANATVVDSQSVESQSIESQSTESQGKTPSNPLLESIWGETLVTATSSAEPLSKPAFALAPASVDSDDLQFARQLFSSQAEQPPSTPTPMPTKETIAPAATVRVNVEHLEQLSHSMGELLTHQNYQSLQTEQLQSSVRSLLSRLQEHQQLLTQFQESFNHRSMAAPQGRKQRKKSRASKKKTPLPASRPAIPAEGLGLGALRDNLDAIHFIQAMLDNNVQLAEVADAIDLFTRQSKQVLATQQRLLNHTRDVLIEARMLPLGEIFDRFPRVLQQLETRHNKPVALSLQGAEVLVDKVVAEKLFDPLLHLVRNAFDHGIEPAAIRQQRGKAPKGQIELSAQHQGGQLVIEVRDDGDGLDFERIRQRVAERQLVPPDQVPHLTPDQLIDFLFEAGFSTAAQVNNLSGRGVGLDVVRAQLQALQGAIVVHSEPQQGTTFILKIPLNLTIAKLLVCQVGGKPHALLIDTIEQIIILQPEQIQNQYGIKVVRWGNGADEQQIPLYSLTQALSYTSPLLALPLTSPPTSPKSSATQTILCRYQGGLVGLEVDQLLDEQELVIRPLGRLIDSPSYVYGASVLADGRLTLVIEPVALIEQILKQRGDRPNANWHNADRHNAASFTPVLPSSRSQPSSLAALPALPASAEPDLKTNIKILIIEDSITVRQSLILTLQRAGYQVSQAKDGQEAIDRLQHSIDVQAIICDLDMPRVSGFEFLRHCQRIPGLANIPVIILTSRSDEKHRSLAAQLGAAAYMTKPYLEYKLLELVAEILKLHSLAPVSG
ncbi:hybrid sensor histidine kinase/response regulator [Phormidium tenue FACHB-886]|nr:hybrid sensor histidine kinase/response regulator [Phormidium tenue FACHB-886]